MRVSVLCPTYGRPERHEQLYQRFLAQTYEDKDLWVLDDSPSPSPFFSTLAPDDRVRYLHSAGRVSIGAKRNWLFGCSRGDVVAHFDDDDWYAPDYLAGMMKALVEGSFDLVKLSVWNAFSEVDGSYWQCDTRTIKPDHFILSSDKPAESRTLTASQMAALPAHDYDGNLWGYGFSYVYRRSLGEKCPFLCVDFGEDYEFIKRARTFGRLGLVSEMADRAIHTMHPKNTAPRIFPETKLDPALLPPELRALHAR